MGNGMCTADDGGFGEDYVQVPDDMLIPASGETPLRQLIQHIYGDLHTMPDTDLPGYLVTRGILAPKNDVVDGVNQVVLDTEPQSALRNPQHHPACGTSSPPADGPLQ